MRFLIPKPDPPNLFRHQQRLNLHILLIGRLEETIASLRNRINNRLAWQWAAITWALALGFVACIWQVPS